MTPAQLAVLRTELQTDPLGLGYATPIAEGAYQTVADLCNNPPAGQTAHVYLPIASPSVVAAIAKAEWLALTPDDRAWLSFVVAQPIVDATVVQLRTDLGALFPAGSQSRSNLLALSQRLATRAEALGVGTVTLADIDAALT